MYLRTVVPVPGALPARRRRHLLRRALLQRPARRGAGRRSPAAAPAELLRPWFVNGGGEGGGGLAAAQFRQFRLVGGVRPGRRHFVPRALLGRAAAEQFRTSRSTSSDWSVHPAVPPIARSRFTLSPQPSIHAPRTTSRPQVVHALATASRSGMCRAAAPPVAPAARLVPAAKVDAAVEEAAALVAALKVIEDDDVAPVRRRRCACSQTSCTLPAPTPNLRVVPSLPRAARAAHRRPPHAPPLQVLLHRRRDRRFLR